MFQHTAARRRLRANDYNIAVAEVFQHTAARRRLGFYRLFCKHLKQFQHTAARRRLIFSVDGVCPEPSFNTQPPEGGCFGLFRRVFALKSFNTQPPEGGCLGF